MSAQRADELRVAEGALDDARAAERMRGAIGEMRGRRTDAVMVACHAQYVATQACFDSSSSWGGW
jgi:hypothetical protein